MDTSFVMEKIACQKSLHGRLKRHTVAMGRAYLLAFSFLGFLTIINFFLLNEIIRAHDYTAELAEAAAEQKSNFLRVSQIVGVSLRTMEHHSHNSRLIKQTQHALEDLSKKILVNLAFIKGGIKQRQQSLTANFFIPSKIKKKQLAVLEERTLFLIDHINQLIALDPDVLPWRFSVWAPIETELASHGTLMTTVDILFSELHQESQDNAKRFSLIHDVLLAITLLTLFAEAFLIFRPLLVRLRKAHNFVDHQHEKLLYHATHDELTGVNNRFAFNRSLNQKAAPSPYAMMIIDLDNFKNINDIFGYLAGDFVLCRVAERLTSLLQKPDRFFRIGGDEFIYIKQEPCPQEMLLFIANQCIQAVSTPIQFESTELNITCSIGVIVFNDSYEGQHEAMRKAHFSLRTAKKKGRGEVVFYDQQHKTATVKAAQLANAINNGEIVPYYQPVVNLSNGQVVGAEALARWQHPVLGILTPQEFLPLIEEYSMLSILTEKMLEQVAGDYRHFKEASIDLNFIAVNFPECVLNNKKMPEQIQAILGSSNLSWLVVEVLEDALLNRSSGTIGVNLKILESMGARIALDDFGTGFASLSHLRSFPCNKIKIDKSFTHDLLFDHASALITKSIINMAYGLGMNVVIEGIESQEQLDFFKEWPKILGQGFYFNKAIPAYELIKGLKQQQNRADSASYLSLP